MTDAAKSTPVMLRMEGCIQRQLGSNAPTPVNHVMSVKHSLNSQILSHPKNKKIVYNKAGKLFDHDKENHHSADTNKAKLSHSSMETPTEVPVGILSIRKRLEQQFSAACNTSSVSGQEVSPGLAKIQNTPGTLKKRRQELIVKHKDIQNHSDQLGVGGGVTLWPEMDVVRMTTKDMLRLLSYAVLLSLITLIVFNKIHGKTFVQLQKFIQEVRAGCEDHRISLNNGSFNDDVILWHKFLLLKSEIIQDYFRLSVASSHCAIYFSSYALGMLTLVYFLVDNMQAKNRLTPFRIKTWTCLLFVIVTWTIFMSFGLYLVFKLEKEAVHCVQQYASALGHLVLTPLDLRTYQSVLLYWRTCLLDNSSDGLIRVLGIVTVKDLTIYIQYYSIPVATVLLTPVIKLISNFWTVYGNGEYVIIKGT